MKILITLSLTGISFLSLKSQIGTLSLSESIPESASVADITVLNPNFDNSFVFIKAHGAFVYLPTSPITKKKTRVFSITGCTTLT